MNIKKFKEENDKERMKFVEYWADYIKRVPDKVWSKQQGMLINSVMKSAIQLSPKEYLSIKGEKCFR